MSIALSLIIPAYNEAERLPAFLESACSYLAERYPDNHEVLVVDDGSEDATGDVVRAFRKQWPRLDLITSASNQGKGAAVRRGMLAGEGEVLLFADADGASPISEEARLASAIDAGADVAVGSRLVRATDVVRRRDWRRAAAGRIFARVARWMVPVSVRDTQCGFKMFRRKAARRLFSLSREQGYVFDIELLALADQLGYRVAEVPIHWTEVPGSKLKMSRDWRHILSGLRRLRRQLRDLKISAAS